MVSQSSCLDVGPASADEKDVQFANGAIETLASQAPFALAWMATIRCSKQFLSVFNANPVVLGGGEQHSVAKKIG